MRWYRLFRRPQDEAQADLERRLQAALKPVRPREAFRAQLKAQLLAHMPSSVEVQRREPALTSLRYSKALWVTVGVAGGLTLLANGIRVAISVLAAIGLWHQTRKQIEERKAATAPPLRMA